MMMMMMYSDDDDDLTFGLSNMTINKQPMTLTPEYKNQMTTFLDSLSTSERTGLEITMSLGKNCCFINHSY